MTATAELIARAKAYLAKQPPGEHRTFFPEHPEVLICELLAALERTPPGDAGEGAKRRALESARGAIASLPEDALGWAKSGVDEWPIRDELLDQVDAALSASPIPPSSPRTGVTMELAKRLAIQLWRWREIDISPEQLIDPMRSALEAALTLPEAGGSDAWWPIDENTLKNRNVLVAYINKLGKWRVVKACYHTHLPWSDEEEGLHEAEYAPEGWYEESETHETIYMLEQAPTHWQPLPSPPEERA